MDLGELQLTLDALVGQIGALTQEVRENKIDNAENIRLVIDRIDNLEKARSMPSLYSPTKIPFIVGDDLNPTDGHPQDPHPPPPYRHTPIPQPQPRNDYHHPQQPRYEYYPPQHPRFDHSIPQQPRNFQNPPLDYNPVLG